MLCDKSENCIYYRTYRYKATARQYLLLVESYCEGGLQPRCQRIRYEDEFEQKAPEELAPNGYMVGSHKKLKINNTRKFKRYKIQNGTCTLKALDTKKTFSAGIVDVSEGGLRLELKEHPNELEISTKKTLLKILDYSIEENPLSFPKEIIKMVWQKNHIIGCSFVAPLA